MGKSPWEYKDLNSDLKIAGDTGSEPGNSSLPKNKALWRIAVGP
jgi:hypothetical protein